MNIAIIPARGGSKRISRKNIREFAGKPIIAYAIGAAKQSGLFEHVESQRMMRKLPISVANGAQRYLLCVRRN